MPSRDSQTIRQQLEVSGPTALGDAVAATRRYASEQRLAPRDKARLCIIIEELVTNLIEHGGGAEQPITIGFARAGPAITVALEDGGPPFDPRNPLDFTEIPARGGGAGLLLVKAWSQVIGYESSGRRNRLALSVPLENN